MKLMLLLTLISSSACILFKRCIDMTDSSNHLYFIDGPNWTSPSSMDCAYAFSTQMQINQSFAKIANAYHFDGEFCRVGTIPSVKLRQLAILDILQDPRAAYVVMSSTGATPLPKTMFAYWLFSGDLMFDNWLGTTTNNFSKDQLDIAWNTAGLKTIIFPSMSVTTIYALDMYYFPFLKYNLISGIVLTDLTFNFWLNMDFNSASGYIVFSNYQTGRVLSLGLSDRKAVWYLFNENLNRISNRLVLGQWTYLTFVCSKQNESIAFYTDANLKGIGATGNITGTFVDHIEFSMYTPTMFMAGVEIYLFAMDITDIEDAKAKSVLYGKA